MTIPGQLLKKYNVPVPRYTSYPPANHFKEGFTVDNYIELLKASNKGKPEHIALYIHIPFCRKICFYCGCNACSIGKGKDVAPYINALKKEINEVSQFIDRKRLVSQIHYGGGTPNAIDAHLITELNEFLFSTFNFINDPEIAIECNPAYLDEQYIHNLLNAKFNRFSLGVQDFNTDVLKKVNRTPSAIPIDKLIKIIKRDKRDITVNLDFIYGLPGQTLEGFIDTIHKAIKVKPDRLVTFSYAHVPWLKTHQQKLEKLGLPDPNLKLQFFLTAYGLLTKNGYESIGLDHYVLPGDELYKALKNNSLHRNFQGYCTKRTTGQVYAFGASSISQLENGYVQNTKDINEYISSLNKETLPVQKGYILSDKQKYIREVITELMCNKRVNWDEISTTMGITAEELRQYVQYNEETMRGFYDDGLLKMNRKGFVISEKGRLFIRNIAASLDPGYQQKDKKYSKSV